MKFTVQGTDLQLQLVPPHTSLAVNFTSGTANTPVQGITMNPRLDQPWPNLVFGSQSFPVVI
jgi:hypothetical protein